MQKYLEDAGVDFQFNTEVTNVIFDFKDGKKIASAIECKVNGVEKGIVLTENDLVFVTNGSFTEGTIYGDLVIQSCDGRGFPVGLVDIGAEFFRMSEGRILCCDIFPE